MFFFIHIQLVISGLESYFQGNFMKLLHFVALPVLTVEVSTGKVISLSRYKGSSVYNTLYL